MLFFKRTLVISMLLLLGTVHAQNNQIQNTNVIDSLSEAYRSAVLKERTKVLLNMLHPEVMFHPPSGPSFGGKETVSQLIVSFLNRNDVTAWDVEIDHRFDFGDSLVEFGRFEILENDTKTSRRKYINIWSKHAGEYKLFFRGWSPL